VLAALEDAATTGSDTAKRLSELGRTIDTTVPGGRAGLAAWMDKHGLAPLPRLAAERRRHVAEAAGASSSMKASPLRLPPELLADILAQAEGAH
jgi:hypothetical protein